MGIMKTYTCIFKQYKHWSLASQPCTFHLHLLCIPALLAAVYPCAFCTPSHWLLVPNSLTEASGGCWWWHTSSITDRGPQHQAGIIANRLQRGKFLPIAREGQNTKGGGEKEELKLMKGFDELEKHLLWVVHPLPGEWHSEWHKLLKQRELHSGERKTKAPVGSGAVSDGAEGKQCKLPFVRPMDARIPTLQQQQHRLALLKAN